MPQQATAYYGIMPLWGADFAKVGLTLVDFVLRNITFSPEYASSVEQKQIAEQEAITNNPELLTYQYITKLSPNISVMLLPNKSPFVFQIPEATP